MAKRLLPNWIKAHLIFTDDSLAPEIFHKWSAISVIAGALRRKTYFNYGYFLLYPNEYITLVGPAGSMKSTAMRLGRQMLSSVPDISFTTDSITRERLIQDMAQSYKDGQSAMTAYSSELGTLLTSSGMDMVVFLTDIFDSPDEWSHRTKIGGTNKIVAPCFNLQACTTPDWLSKAMPLDTIGIGLTSRILFVYASDPKFDKDPFPVLSKDQIELKHLMGKDLASISMIEGEYRFTADALVEYKKWFKDHLKNSNKFGDSRLNGYFARKPIHIIKVCMIVAAAQRDETVMELNDLLATFQLFDEIEVNMPRVFANVGKNPFSMDYEEAMMCIYQHGSPIEFGEVLKRMKHTVKQSELEEVLGSLVKMKMVQVEVTPKGVFYSPV